MFRVVFVSLALTAIATTSRAVDFDQSPLFRQLQFNFGNPGARALAMGGAFIGRTDDASAAEANPGGLLPLSRHPEITIEVRSFVLTQHLVAGGLAPQVDFMSISNSATPRPTFASIVFPRPRSTFAVYFHTPFDYRQEANIPRATAVISDTASIFRSPTDAAIDYRTESYAVAGAWCLTGCPEEVDGLPFGAPSVARNRLSIGAALKLQRLSARLTSEFFAADRSTLERAVPERRVATIGAESGDIRVASSIGIRWMSAKDKFGVGAVYKTGARFNVLEFCTNPPQGGECIPESFVRQSTFTTPDVLGVGFSYKFGADDKGTEDRAQQTITMNLDVNRVNYSVLTRDFTPSFPGPGNVSAEEAGYRLADVTEIHAGVQWNIPGKVTLRAGYWYEPRHSLEYVGRVASFDERLAALLYPGGRNLHHVTAGVGYNLSTYVVDVGYDHARDQRTLAISLQMRL